MKIQFLLLVLMGLTSLPHLEAGPASLIKRSCSSLSRTIQWLGFNKRRKVSEGNSKSENHQSDRVAETAEKRDRVAETPEKRGKDVTLFEMENDGVTPKPIEKYDKAIKKLKKGDRIHFTDRSFKLGKKLGEGATTVVFKLADFPDSAIRIPKARVVEDLPGAEYLHYFVQGEKALVEHGIPHPAVKFYSPGEFIVVERIPANYSFVQFVSPKKAGIPAELHQLMKDRLVEFARRTADFAHIGDFKAEQLLFDKQRLEWILCDWTSDHIMFDRNNTKHRRRTVFHRQFFQHWEVFYDGYMGEWKSVSPTGSRAWLAPFAEKLENAALNARSKANLN